MKFTKTIALALAVGVVASAAFAEEEEGSSVGTYAYTALKNGYISNGYLFYDDATLQSGAGVTFGGFDLNVWNSWGVGKDRTRYGSSSASEIDYELDYSYSYEDFDLSAGVAAWCYPQTDDSFDDWVGKLAVGYNGWIVRPELNARFGLDGQQGCYGQFKLSKGFDLADGLSLDVYGLIGGASKSYRARKGAKDELTGAWLCKNVDKDGLVDAEFGAKVTYELCDNASINVGVMYSVIVDGDLRDYCEYVQADGDKDHFIYYAGADIWF